MAKKLWIKGTIKRPGALTKKAKAAGKTVKAFCATRMKGSSRTARQCRMAKTLRAMPKRRR